MCASSKRKAENIVLINIDTEVSGASRATTEKDDTRLESGFWFENLVSENSRAFTSIKALNCLLSQLLRNILSIFHIEATFLLKYKSFNERVSARLIQKEKKFLLIAFGRQSEPMTDAD